MNGAPSKTRYRVVALCVALAGVTYLDRACIGTLAPDIMRDLRLTKAEMSAIYSAFAVAYAAGEIPTAWWADRIGTRRVLTRIVLWWSAFTMLTGAAWSAGSMLITRFLFGAGEAGAWPGVARTFSRWLPRRERGRTQGIFFCGAHLAGGVTPVVVLALLHVMNWRAVFVACGGIGMLWAIAWYRWFRDEPAEHPAVNAAERAEIEAGRESAAAHPVGWAYWRRLAVHRNTAALCIMYFPNSFAFYFCITWLPTYLRERHGFNSLSLGVFTGLPLLLSVLGDLFGGLATDGLTRKFGLRVGRAGVGAAAYVVAGATMGLAAVATSPIAAAWLLAAALGASMFVLAPAWSTCLDVGGRHSAVVSAAMNTSGQIGAVVSPLLVTFLLTRWGSWNGPIFVMSVLFFVGAVAWARIDPADRIFD